MEKIKKLGLESEEQREFFLRYFKQFPTIVQNDGDKGKRHFILEIDRLYNEGKITDTKKEILLSYLDLCCIAYNVN